MLQHELSKIDYGDTSLTDEQINVIQELLEQTFVRASIGAQLLSCLHKNKELVDFLSDLSQTDGVDLNVDIVKDWLEKTKFEHKELHESVIHSEEEWMEKAFNLQQVFAKSKFNVMDVIATD